jgi:hypothetical protein
MMRCAALLLGVLVCSPATVFAQEPAFMLAGAVPPAAFAAQPVAAPLTASAVDVAGTKRGVLLPLYVSFGVLQALDFQSTRTALATGGGREANPLMNGVVGSPAGFFALKAATGAAVILASEKMRPRNRIAAIATMVALNGLYASIVSHNYAVAGR